ncbi:type I polyketide synthase [Humitalea sp. 24SJ18S-53]|uniref:type I polyketide synthase n=1 Tax=Humitalea sp. 24SJ18S-53 TaxID=3422307 RepID=UPI003D673147
MTRRPGPAGPGRLSRHASALPPRKPAGPAAPRPIAIVGAACRFPGADGLDAFWRLMLDGVDAVGTLPADRFNQDRFFHPRRGEPGRSYSFAAGHIGDAAAFDAAAFGLSPREAAEMDPQQRLLLEVTQHAFEDAGWTADDRAGQTIGVYVGGSSTDYAELRLSDPSGGDRYFMTGNALSILSNRLTNVFDLRGPGQTIDTACSSALVALDLAVQAVRMGRVDAAVVGGVQMLLSPYAFLGFSSASMLSPTGRCHPFGAAADGYVRAEGAGTIILKPLDQALADGDRVRAVLLGTGVNAAGRTIGLSLPNEQAQARLMGQVLAETGVHPDRLAYFEAHGTGTQVGDPLEAEAIGRAVGTHRARPLPVGSVKSNIGHLEPASGMAGLLKAMLILEHGVVPPSLHATPANPNIAFGKLNLRVVTAAEPLGRPDQGAVIGVNSFGFGGTNATVLLAAAPADAPADTALAAGGQAPALLLSARSAPQLRALAAAWQARLGQPGADGAHLARGAARHRDLWTHRLAVRGPDAMAMARSIAGWAGGKVAQGVTLGVTQGVARVSGAQRGPRATPGGDIAFVFSGNGAQHAAMGREALANPAFRTGLTAADAVLTPLLGWSVLDVVARGTTDDALAATEIAQPLIFATQVATLAALAAEGITPAMVFGHSVGEVAAAFAAGILDLPDAARLIVARSRAQAATRGRGRMAALATDAATAAPLLAAAGPGLEIAAVNAPASLTIAGPGEAIARLAAAMDAARVPCIPLDLDYAFHSAAMEPVGVALVDDLAGLAPRAGQVPFISTVTGARIDGTEADGAYWWRNLRQPVRFHDATRSALAAGARIFIEIGSHAVLQSYLRESARAENLDAVNLPTLTRRDGLGDPFPGIADRAFVRGVDTRGATALAGPPARRMLPLTPFARSRVWMPVSSESARLQDPVQDHPLLGFRQGAAPALWRHALDTALMPWLADHALGGDPVLPAAAMLDMALAALAARMPEAVAWEVASFQILRPLTLEQDRARETLCTLDQDGGFRIESRRRMSDDAWTLHARGRVAASSGAAVPPAVDWPAALAEGKPLSGARLRDRAQRLGLSYGPAFAAVVSVRAEPGAGRADVTLRLPDTAPPAGFLLHPSLLDGAFQGLLGLVAMDLPLGDVPLPVRLGRLVMLRGGGVPVLARIHVTRRGSRAASADMLLLDGTGRAVAVLRDLWLQRIRLPAGDRATGVPEAIETCLLPMPDGPTPAPAPGPAQARARRAAEALDVTLDARETALLLEAAIASAAQAALRGDAASQALFRGPLRRAVDRALIEDGLVEADPAGTGTRPVEGAALPDAGDIWRQVMTEAPSLAPDLAWLARSIETLPVALMGSDAGAAQAGTLPPIGSGGWARLVQVVAAAAEAAVAGWPAARPLRVLEVGVGGLAAPLATALAAQGRRVVLTIATLQGAAPPIAPPGVEIHQAAWAPGQPLPPADLILGVAPSAMSRAGRAIAPVLAASLAPGGILLLAEPAPGRLWDLCCGQDPAWWEGEGLPDAPAWTIALHEAGLAGAEARHLVAAPWPALLLAGHRPAEAPVAEPSATTLLLADAASAALADALAPLLPALAERAAFPAEILPRRLRGARVVVLLAPEPAGLATCLGALMRLAETCRGTGASFCVVVRGAEAGDAGAAAVLAALRVLANEMTELKPVRIDLDPGIAASAAAALLAAALAQDGEPEVVLTPAARLAPRVAALPQSEAPGPRSLAIRHPGNLGTLAWEPMAQPAVPGPGEVVLRVLAAGLNFRDVMWAQGLLPEEALMDGFAGAGLGMECAGVVEAVGAGAMHRPGDRVFGFAPRALADRAVTRDAALVPLPQGLDPAAAATLPVAFMTAIHALEGCARIAPGESVLIHGGAGGVGLAALQVAQAAGARVVATAGTAARRAFLRLAGADLVLDSRDPDFADALRAAWPEGVDVVLNSLAGDAMEQGLSLLKPFGRFIELGKRDFFEDRRVSLRPLRRNVTYFAVDVDELPVARPDAAQAALRRMLALAGSGAARPLPHAVRAASEIEAAFRTLQAGTHFGKIVIIPPQAGVATAEAPPAVEWVPPPGTVVVTGGTSGFGLEAAKWLSARGVKRLALISRRGPATPGMDRAIAALAGLGADASAHACDVADPVALAATLAAIRADGAIGGVVHAAAVFDDGAATALDDARFAAVLRPKLDAALALDRLTAGDPLGLFLLFSSATTLLGNPGQANYVAANAGLEALARRRHAMGRPALAVAWGPIADTGVLAADAATAAVLQRRIGAAPMAAMAALDALPALFASGRPVVALAQLAWGKAGALLPILAEPMFTAMRGTDTARPPEDLRAELRALAPDQLRERLVALAVEEVARILRLPPDNVLPDAPVASLGLDSLGALELRTALEQRIGQAVPLAAVTEDLTIARLAARIAEGLSDTRGEMAMDALVESFEPQAALEPVAAPRDGGV